MSKTENESPIKAINPNPLIGSIAGASGQIISCLLHPLENVKLRF